jgi:tetratricopeptide (TPR) repeat protein
MAGVSIVFCSLLAQMGQGALCDAGYLDALTRAAAHHRAFAYDEALRAYRDALARDPSGFHALFGLADAGNDRGEEVEGGAGAEEAFTVALGHAQCLEDLYPESPEGPAWIAASYGNLTRGASPGQKVAFSREIAAAARRALLRDPAHVSALVALGIYEREMSTLGFFARAAVRVLGGLEASSLEESERLLRLAVAGDPGRLLARYELGLTLLAAGQREEAEAVLRAVLERVPAEASDVSRQLDAARRLDGLRRER